MTLSDASIAAHEAGHALVAHLLGDEIDYVEMYDGPQHAYVKPIDADAVHVETIMAGFMGQSIAGFATSTEVCRGDLEWIGQFKDPPLVGVSALIRAHWEGFEELRR